MTAVLVRHVCENRDAHPSGREATYLSGRPDPVLWAAWCACHRPHGFRTTDDEDGHA